MTAKRALLRTLEVALPVCLIALWWFASRNSKSLFFPPLESIWTEFHGTYIFDRFDKDVLPNLARLAAGFALAAVAGIAGGMVLGLSQRIRRLLLPLVEFFRAIPVVALLPAALILLGTGNVMEVSMIAFAAVWPILISTASGVASVEPVMLDTARIYGLSRARTIREIALPAASPQIFAGLRIALPLAIALMVVSNMFGTTNGIGYAVVMAQQTFNVRANWAAIIMAGLIGSVLNVTLRQIEWTTLAWHRRWRARAESAA